MSTLKQTTEPLLQLETIIVNGSEEKIVKLFSTLHFFSFQNEVKG